MVARRTFLAGLVLALPALSVVSVTALSSTALADDKGGAGYITTGEGVRTKTVLFVKAKVYAIRHEMRGLPTTKTKQGVIEAETDKRFVLRMLRTVDREKMQDALESAYKLNGFTDQTRVAKFLGAMTHEIKEGTTITFAYQAATKRTTLTVEGDGMASVDGSDFMRGTWQIWLGKIDQPELGDSLVQRLH